MKRILTACLLSLSLGTCALSEPHYVDHQHINQQPVAEAPKRIAIIGAGAGGSSTAYHLKQYASIAGFNTDITIFERNAYIGGRTTTVDAWDDPSEPVELGGSIFVKVNKILVDAASHFNLSTSSKDSDSDESDAPELGVWNGQEFVFEQSSSSYIWWDLAKLLWKYGYSPIKTNNLMKEVVGKFLQMYEEPYFPFSSLSDVAYELGLTQVTAVTGEQFLKANGISDAFAKDLVQASTRVNYAQNLPLIHGLETMVCMAAQGAMSVEGGNWQIFSNMAQSSASTVHLNTSVESISRTSSGQFVLKTEPDSSSASSDASTTFDTVILAAPYQLSSITLPQTSHVPDEIAYVSLHVTLFSSPHVLSPVAFSLDPTSPVPRVILTTLLSTESPGTDPHFVGAAGFFSISTLRTAINPSTGKKEYLYKIFSPAPVEEVRLAELLGLVGDTPSKEDVTWIHRKVWNSYPYEYPRVTFEEMKLDDGLWYTSGIESFISTMETSALSGKNVARLIVDEWTKGDGSGEDVDRGDARKDKSQQEL